MNWHELKSIGVSQLSKHYPDREAHQICVQIIRELTGQSYIFLARNQVDETMLQKFREIVHDVQKGQSIQVALGVGYFKEMAFKVTKEVLAPRPETEELVDWMETSIFPEQHILDIGTGTGCIPIYLKKKHPESNISTIDVSEESLEIAQKNAALYQTELNFFQGDILSMKKLPGNYHHIVSNPPYIPFNEKEKMEELVINNDPSLALFVPENDPLIFYRKIAELGLSHLEEGGNLWFEIHENYGAEIKSLLAIKGYKNIKLKPDFYGKDRMVNAQKVNT